jgi:hypothetical protein
VFKENCTRLGIPQGDDEVGYAIAFSLMLKDETHLHYMTDIHGKDMEFWMMTASMKAKLEVQGSALKYLPADKIVTNVTHRSRVTGLSYVSCFSSQELERPLY